MHREIEQVKREIVNAFNLKPKMGLQKIYDICKAHNLSPVEEYIATFFHDQKSNLDLELVGDYLSGPEVENKAVLKAFTSQIDFSGQNFSDGLRHFLKTFKLPGEAQKIDRVIESFSQAYYQKNQDGSIANADAAYILAFQSIMLNTDLHNPSIPMNKKMDFNGLKKNLKGCNNGRDFDEIFLKEIYSGIQAKPFELNFVKISPGYELTSNTFNHDKFFKKLDSILHSPKRTHDFFPELEVIVDKAKSWLNRLMGYEGTITLTKEETKEPLVTVQIYKPGFFARLLFGEQSRVVIQPIYQNEKVAENPMKIYKQKLGLFLQSETPKVGNQELVELAAKIAASFESPVTSIKATYGNEKDDLQHAYDEQKRLISGEYLKPW